MNPSLTKRPSCERHRHRPSHPFTHNTNNDIILPIITHSFNGCSRSRLMQQQQQQQSTHRHRRHRRRRPSLSSSARGPRLHNNNNNNNENSSVVDSERSSCDCREKASKRERRTHTYQRRNNNVVMTTSSRAILVLVGVLIFWIEPSHAWTSTTTTTTTTRTSTTPTSASTTRRSRPSRSFRDTSSLSASVITSTAAVAAIGLPPQNGTATDSLLLPGAGQTRTWNRQHRQWSWPTNNNNWYDRTTAAAAAAATIEQQQQQRQQQQQQQQQPTVMEQTNQFHVYCDLDGVLVDFEKGIHQLFPELVSDRDSQQQPISLQDLERSVMWKRVTQANAFFQHLSWTHDGPILWQAIQHLQPDILTGIPAMHPSARQEKFLWCTRELSESTLHRQRPIHHIDMAGRFFTHTPTRKTLTTMIASSASATNNHDDHNDVIRPCRVITCWSSNKHYQSRPGAVLIDDQEWLRQDWESKGGIFIHHKVGNVDATLEQLRRHGILTDGCSNNEQTMP